MVEQVTIVFEVPLEIGEKYSTKFMTKHFESLVHTTFELPHPDYKGDLFTAQILDVTINT